LGNAKGKNYSLSKNCVFNILLFVIMNNKIYNWEKIYYGQSPGDLENKNNGFAGRFSGYNNKIISPSTDLNSELPVILIVGDSIIGDICVLNIREKFKGIANVNFLQQPHHCKNIDSWLEEWKINDWKHYHCVFWFDGMHGFPERVTEEEHQKLTPKLINNLQKSIKNILWCNCTPIPDDFPQNKTNSVRGPNSKEQRVINESVINRNKSIEIVTKQLNIELLDIYSLTKPILHLIQKPKDLHFYPKGELIISNHIIKKIKKLYFNINIMKEFVTNEKIGITE